MLGNLHVRLGVGVEVKALGLHHPTELSVRALQYSTLPGENVLELFGGSGSALIACEMTGRRCFAMEIDRWYTDIIVKRWEEFTGRKAELVRRSDDGSNQ